MAGLVEQMDAQLEKLFSGWNLYSTLLLASLISYVAYTLLTAEDPDTHPMILLRQSAASQVRNPGESAVYRSPEIPHGYPLKTGLNVKTPGAPAYAGGKDGDLRDIWRRASGLLPLEKSPWEKEAPPSRKGKLLTVMGRQDVVEHDVADLEREMAVVGDCVSKHGGKRIAVYLPNCVELLESIFAAAFYGLDVILIPYNQPHPLVIRYLLDTKADTLVAQAGSIPLNDITRSIPALHHVIWVVEKTSRHVDWTEITGGSTEISQWHELVSEHSSPIDLPDLPPTALGTIVTICQDQPGSEGDIVEFSQANFVAAIGAATSALPARQRLSPSDLFLPTDVLTSTYPLVLTLAALFAHATVALTSVAGPGVDLAVVTRAIAPTVLVASAETAKTLHETTFDALTGFPQKLAHWLQTRALDAGRMPAASFLTRFNAPTLAAIAAPPGKLRLVFVGQRAGTVLSSAALSDLRVFTGARVVYALTAAEVVGAVAQTSVFDYRRETLTKGEPERNSHFGAPVSCVEIKLKDTGVHRTTDREAVGEIVVVGPAVKDGEANLGVVGRFRDDFTLAFV